MKTKTIDIVAREWFDKVNGNSYFSAYMTVNWQLPSEQNFHIPFQYGYGEHYLTECLEVLKKHNVVKCDDRTALWRICDENKIMLRHSKIRNCKKSSL